MRALTLDTAGFNVPKMRWLLAPTLVLACILIPPAVVLAHPHNENPIVVLTGTLVNVDLETKTIQVNGYDPDTKSTRTVVLFLDPKVKVRYGKRRVVLTEISVGLRVRCTAEKEIDHDSRLVAFEVSVDAPAR